MRVAASFLMLAALVVAFPAAGAGTPGKDGTRPGRIVFSAGPDSSSAGADIYTVGSDGSGQTRLTSGTSRDTDPVWSPDRRRIAFVRRVRAGADVQLLVMDANGRSVREISAGGHSPSWSPDGRWIAFTKGYGRNIVVWTVSSGGGGARRLGPGQDPSWSPDGRRIAFVRVGEDALAVFIMNSDGTQVRRLVDERRLESSRLPAWSPDGRRIAFVGGVEGMGSLYVVELTGRGLTRLVASPSHRGDPEWSPDGTRIQLNADHALFVARADGGGSAA